MILAPTLTLSAGSGAAIVRPTFSRDFAGEKTLNNGTGPAITFTRASNATFFNASGVLQTASNDQPRFDHSGGSSLGLLIEESRTNSIRNSQAGGSTNGVIGSGGAFPTNGWSASGHNTNGITTEIIQTGTEGGLAYIDIKLSGTPSATATAFLLFEESSRVVASNGQTWTHSAYVKLQAGSSSNATIAINLAGRLSDGTPIAGQALPASFTPTSSSLNTQRRSTTFTFSDATVARVLPFLQVSYTSGQPIDLTLRIAAPQLEQGAFPTSYIPTTTAAATRSADSAVVTPISSFYNQSEGTLFAEASYTAGATDRIILQVDNETAGDRALLYFTTTSTREFFVRTAAGPQAIITRTGATTGGTPYKLIGAVKENDFQLATDGTLGIADTNGVLPVVTHMRVGRGTAASANFLNGHIRKIAYWPKRLSNTLLQQLTT